MSELLSPGDIDALLGMIQSGEVEAYYSATATQPIGVVDFRSNRYRLTKTQISALQVIHEDFARYAAVRLSRKTGQDVSLFVGSVGQLSPEEFLRCLPSPTNCAIFCPRPLSGESLLHLPLRVTLSLLDFILGGSGNPGESRLPTPVEISILEGVVVEILGCLRLSWASTADLRPSFANIEHQPALLRDVLPPDAPCVMISIEARVGDAEDMMYICYSQETLRPLLWALGDRNLGISPFPSAPLDFPVRGRYGFPDVYVPFGEIPAVGDVVRLPEMQMLWRAL